MQQVLQGDKRAERSAGPSWSATSAVARVPAHPSCGRAVSVAWRYLFPPHRTQLCRSDLILLSHKILDCVF
jgi:hypothetical protein